MSDTKRVNFNEAIALMGKYMASGVIWREGNALVGKASDGQIVTLESDMTRPTAARDATRYLASHPTPDTW